MNFEEPESWGVTPAGVGYDVRGATRVRFDVRVPTPGGLSVEFLVGGMSAGYRHIAESATFGEVVIELAALGLTAADLEDLHLLFGVATNDVNAPTGGTILLDNIRFEPVPDSALTNPSLPLANQTFGVISVSSHQPGRVPIPPDQLLRNLATVYESAITAQALLLPRTPESQALATHVADGLLYALDHPNSGIAVPEGPGGLKGLQSGFSAGPLPLNNDQAVARRGEVRLAGFSGPASLCGPSRFCVLLDGGTGGNNAFAVKALLEVFIRTGDHRYLTGARTIAGWIHDRLWDPDASGFGGYFLGYRDEGELPKTLITTKSIENNADIFAAFTTLAAVERMLGTGAADLWDARARLAGDFVIAMFDTVDGRFFAGTVPVDTPPGDGVAPNGPQQGNDVTNTFDFLDAQTFSILALAESTEYRTRLDWRRPLQWAIDHQPQTVTAGGQTYDGFNIVSPATAGPEGVAWEFTAQIVVAMRLLDRLYGETRFAGAAAHYLGEIERAQAAAPFTDGRGLPASTLEDGDLLPPYEHCLSTPFQCIAQRVGLAATTWAIFAELGVNPLGATPPTAFEDAFTTSYQTPLVVSAPGVLGNDDTRGGGPLTALLVTGTAYGTLALGDDGSVTYTPASGYFGPDSFTYRAGNLSGFGNTATVRITVAPPLPPTAVDDAFSTPFQTPLSVPAPGVLANDHSPGGGPMIVTLVTGVTRGRLELTATGAFSYTPDAGVTGSDSFTYRAVNAGGAGSVATVRIAIAEPGTVLPPTNLQVWSIDGHVVTLRWMPPAAGPIPDEYVVEGGVSPGGVLASLRTESAAPIFSFTAPEGAFFVRVHDRSGAERSLASNEVRLFVDTPTAPSAPVGLLGAVNGSSLALTWRLTFGGAAPTGTTLEVSGAATLSLPLGLGESFSISGVPAGTYTLAVRASNPGGSSAASDPITLAFPGPCSGPPLPPAAFLAYRVGRTLTAVWQSAASGPAPTSYRVDVAGAYTGSFDTTERILSGSASPGRYDLSVTARNTCGSSQPTAVQSVLVP